MTDRNRRLIDAAGDAKVYETDHWEGERGRFRTLQFGEEAMQGAMDLERPGRILFEYPRAMLHVIEANLPDFESVYLIGYGVGTIPHALRSQRCCGAEIDAAVLSLANRYFHPPSDDIRLGDGRLLLTKEPPGTFDAVIVDAFTSEGVPRQLTTSEWMSIVVDKLTERGILLMNVTGRGMHDFGIRSIHTTMLEHFAYTRSFLLPAIGAGPRNILLIGCSDPITSQIRNMAGFQEVQLEAGRLLQD